MKAGDGFGRTFAETPAEEWAAHVALIESPCPAPCRSCPYRRDVPSGVWAPEEYEKLPLYDLPTGEQPVGVFACHQQDGHVCAGWAAVHDGEELMSLRLAVHAGKMSPEAAERTVDYTSPVPVFGSGEEAAAHGLRELTEPGEDAARTIARLRRKRVRNNL